MEESGHYYTVYFTSLAVGFDEEVAYKHAALAQMPDEVGFLDAANMHIIQCKRFATEIDLQGNKAASTSEWRFLIEYVIHSLPDRQTGNTSSSHQRKVTRKLLLGSKPDSIEFGVLLHRLGDTYAHSEMGKEHKMYTTTTSGAMVDCLKPDSLGHARHLHDPDHPYQRPVLFYKYLEDLYDILYKKVGEKESIPFRRKATAIPFIELKGIFHNILEAPNGLVRLSVKVGLSSGKTQLFLIQGIREKCKQALGITMRKYAPESIEKQTLKEFLDGHPDLKGLGINERSIRNALKTMNAGL